jgi:glyoxylase-like metal-dependent hydrolase (beta-lactamase superfamily II)
MLIESFPAGIWQTNCYVVASQRNAECIIIDPGFNCADQVAEIVRDNNLKPVATLLTHGHLDHMWSVVPVAKGYDIPAYIHASDKYLLADPMAGISAETVATLSESLVGVSFVEPSEVIEFNSRTKISIAGIEIDLIPAPGHTAGSTIFQINDDSQTVFTGDVLFAGAIGRTDLPGGSLDQMNETLRSVILPLPDGSRVLPGHGAESTMEIERVNNPFLRRVAQGLSAV